MTFFNEMSILFKLIILRMSILFCNFADGYEGRRKALKLNPLKFHVEQKSNLNPKSRKGIKIMKHSVNVIIERQQDKIIVSNNHGVKWEFVRKDPYGTDHSLNGGIADIASAMLTSTIVSHLEELSSPKITYTLTIDK